MRWVDVLDVVVPGVLGSSDPAGCVAVSGDAVEDDDAVSLVALAAAVTPGFALLVVELDALPASVLSVWLISISCSRLFTCTSWLMYSLGSVFAVGS